MEKNKKYKKLKRARDYVHVELVTKATSSAAGEKNQLTVGENGIIASRLGYAIIGLLPMSGEDDISENKRTTQPVLRFIAAPRGGGSETAVVGQGR